MQSIFYYFWMNSDWAYLGADRLQALAQRYALRIQYRPVDLPEVYRRTGGVLLHQRSPERQAYRVLELKRWCRHLGVNIHAQPAHMCPNADLASCLVIAVDQAGLPVADLYKAILAAEWVQERDISAPETLCDILLAQGLATHWLQAAEASSVQALYRRYTDEAVLAGVFGSPSYIFQGELFWGQDRIEMLEAAVAAA